MIDLLCLIEFYNTYDQSDIFHEISRKMIENFTRIENMGMQELADYLYVSTSTLYRFIKMMSYENRNEMRQCQQMFFENYMYSGRYMPKQIAVAENFGEYGEYLCRNIRQVTSAISTDKVNKIVQAMLEADNIIFVGNPMSSTIWRLQVELVLLGKKTSAFLNPQLQYEAVEKADEKDCVFMVQYLTEEAPFYREVAEKVAKRGMPSVLISNVPISPIIQLIRYPISFEGEMCESDMIMTSIILNMIGNQLNRKVLELNNHSETE